MKHTKPNSRKGLKKMGLRAYKLEAAGMSYIIRRDTPRRWLVRKSDMPDLGWNFFAITFHTLREARKWANDMLWPYPKKALIRQRNRRFKSDPRALVQAARAIAEARKKDGDHGSE